MGLIPPVISKKPYQGVLIGSKNCSGCEQTGLQSPPELLVASMISDKATQTAYNASVRNNSVPSHVQSTNLVI